MPPFDVLLFFPDAFPAEALPASLFEAEPFPGDLGLVPALFLPVSSVTSITIGSPFFPPAFLTPLPAFFPVPFFLPAPVFLLGALVVLEVLAGLADFADFALAIGLDLADSFGSRLLDRVLASDLLRDAEVFRDFVSDVERDVDLFVPLAVDAFLAGAAFFPPLAVAGRAAIFPFAAGLAVFAFAPRDEERRGSDVDFVRLDERPPLPMCYC